MNADNYALVGLGIYIVVGLAKKAKLPTMWRMPLALALAIATGAADVLITGAGWHAALRGALLAGASAVGFNEVREHLPGGRYRAKASGPPPAAIVLLVLGLGLGGCGSARTCVATVEGSAAGLLGFCRVAYEQVQTEGELAEVDKVCAPIMKAAEPIEDRDLVVSLCDRVSK